MIGYDSEKSARLYYQKSTCSLVNYRYTVDAAKASELLRWRVIVIVYSISNGHDLLGTIILFWFFFMLLLVFTQTHSIYPFQFQLNFNYSRWFLNSHVLQCDLKKVLFLQHHLNLVNMTTCKAPTVSQTRQNYLEKTTLRIEKHFFPKTKIIKRIICKLLINI